MDWGPLIAERRPKAGIIAAQQIMRDAARRKLGPGDKLPSERDMMVQYGVARGTLREALRLLEFQGALMLKPGPNGGPVLLEPDASFLSSALLVFMQLRGAPYRQIVEVRHSLEPITSRLAAARIQDSELEQLEASMAMMRDNLDDVHTFFEANKDFHNLIAWSSGNVMLGYVNESLLHIIDGTSIGINYPEKRRKSILAAHERIFDALSKHDADDAESKMAEHIHEYMQYAERHFPEVLERAVQWS